MFMKMSNILRIVGFAAMIILIIFIIVSALFIK